MGSSSEANVMEIAPPRDDWTSKLKAKGKQKEVAFHEIIDLDMDEDCDDVVLLEGNIHESRKRVRDSMDISLGPSTSSPKKVASNNKGEGIPLEPDYSYKGFNPGSNNFFDLDDYVYDDEDMLLAQDATVNGPNSINLSSVETTSSMAKLVDGDVQKRSKSSKKGETRSSKAKLLDDAVQKKYESFKKFDIVMDHSDHHFENLNSAKKQAAKMIPKCMRKDYDSHVSYQYYKMTQPRAKNWATKIQEEWKILEKDLPDTIFVRAYESRMDLLRAVIIGAEGTPYHDGLFFFDLVHYHSGGLHINPNLYPCGKVCLSLLNTWSGGHQERWLPGTSTMLQVLVSIQGLILNMKPYFNEPGYAPLSGFADREKASLQYNENTLILSLKTMVYTMKKPPKHFEDLVIGHFQHRVRDILMACKAYTEGVQVGCVVKGGVQDVDEGANSCSHAFKNDLGSYIKTLVAAFKKIGAKEAKEFLS